MKTQIVALIASLLLASSVFASAPAATEEKDAKHPASAIEEVKEEGKTEEEAKK